MTAARRLLEVKAALRRGHLIARALAGCILDPREL